MGRGGRVGESLDLAAQIVALGGADLALKYLTTNDSFERGLIVKLMERASKEIMKRDDNLAIAIAIKVREAVFGK